ncbi:MAG TPA: hypothetical protein VEL28_07065 [Candidatus Binatia bacterium]|nr:hypothetical protein [Candidatus Binatia bacterium]
MSRLAGVLLVLFVSTTVFAGGAGFLAPKPYTSVADSYFDIGAADVCIEDFEDDSLNVPAASGNGTIVSGQGNIDSVDADDGVIDGSGTGGHSYFSGNGAAGITITFDPFYGNGYPSQVGIVWTDGGPNSAITFSALDGNGISLGSISPLTSHADASNAGTTAEDRLYALTSLTGISSITITNSTGGIEVDHLQYNNCFICGEVTGDQKVLAGDALATLKAAVGSMWCVLCMCDVNESGDVTATDSLIVLKHAVGQDVDLNCPTCLEVK